MTTAPSRAVVPIGLATSARARTRPEFYLDVVVKSGLDVSVADAITAGDIERTMDGASTLTLTLHDPHRALVRNPDLARAIDMRFAGYWWRLVKVSKAGDELTLTFEDRDVAYLRRHTKPRKAKRNAMTRAQFVRQLVREVGQRPIRKGRSKTRPVGQKPIVFVCPELKTRQPLASSAAPAKRKKSKRAQDREAGINARANLTVKGAKATAEQRRNGERVLDVADSLNAGPKATLALMEAVIVESTVRNLSHGDRDSIGILQLRVTMHGRRTAASIERSTHAFLTRGFTGRGGAMALARSHSGWSAGQVAQGVQGSAFPGNYTKVAREAREWIEAYGGASGSDTGGTSRSDRPSARKKYEFRRGEPGKREDSWTAIQRLAEEVHWHAFMDRGRLYYVSDDWIMRQKARYIVDEDDDGVDEINFDIDGGKVSSEVAVIAHAKRFQVPVGCVMRIRNCGIADGRYVVTRVRQSIYATSCEIGLRAATPKLGEPATMDAGGIGPQGDDSGLGTLNVGSGEQVGKQAGNLRERIVAVAQASRASYNRNPRAWHYLAGGTWNTADPTRPPRPGTRSDCSQWVAAVYKRAGAPAPGPNYGGIYTGNMRVRGREVPLSQARPGDIILYGPAPSHHVELVVGPGQRTIGHGSPPVDYGTARMMSDPHCWRYSFLDD